MVGIKGRSKACRTCLRRKKGCGKQRPSCEQCLRAGLPCGGYHADFVFVDHSRSQAAARKTDEAALVQRCLLAPATAHHAQVLTQSAHELRICGRFWDMYLPNRRQLPLDLTRNALGGWVGSVQDLHTTHPVLRKSMLALALVTIARHEEGGGPMETQGQRLYAEALGELRLALRTAPGRRRTRGMDEALYASIRLFGLYEMLHGADEDLPPSGAGGEVTVRRSWQTHCFGDFGFVAAHAPEDFAEGHSHELFVEARLVLGILSVIARKRTFLTTEPWTTLPWAVRKKTPRDLLLDICLEIAGLFQDLDDSAKLEPDEQRLVLGQIVARCVQVQERLLAWHESHAATPCLAAREDQVPSSIKAVDLAVAHVMGIYWAAALMVTNLHDNLLSYSPPSSSSSSSSPDPPLFDTDGLCRRLVHVIPACLHPDAGIFRTAIIAFPLSVAALHFSIIPPASMPAERAWLEENLRKPVCLPIMSFVRSLGCVGKQLFGPMEAAPEQPRPAGGPG